MTYVDLTGVQKGSLVLPLRRAREAGFIIFDSSALWGDTAVDDYVMSQWDMHPNAPGHAMIAVAIIEVMRSDPALGFARDGEP